ncbi:YfjI family protein [Streptomyces sp. NBC_01762]|uniref:YfjI family protein n=1 Tax=unclassified Streptomyces TaxID=2593676 RepID=UPI002DD80B36|nr:MULTISPECIES: YfjI family protein [unclassified Streptomyces]WSC47940.1 YfjI family protein [Streptomyces sp. NBC_01762]WSD27591.1 YfjI family protein [Streptomyces sp. NBC_01751]
MTADLWEGFDALDPETITGPMWDEPVPLNRRHTLPAFPVHALPPWLGNMASEVAEETQTPVELAGCLALAVIATAAGGKVNVCVRGHWREPVNIFTAVALDPGNRKSAVFALMVDPLLSVEKTLVELSGPVRAEVETRIRLAKAAAENATKKAAAAEPGMREQLTAEAVHLTQEAEELTPPAKPQLVADDITPENIGTLLDQQGGRISLMSAEGEIFDIMAGRYGGKPNLGMFLKGHAGDMIRVNRQGRDGEHVEHPALTMGVAIQPAVLDTIGRVDGADGRGLLARFLYSKPRSLVGSRNLTPALLSEETAAAYAKRLGGLTMALADWTEAVTLTLTPAADAVMLAYQKVTESRLGKGSSLAPIVKWASKRDGAVARIAALLHLATHPENGWVLPIEAATMAAATELGDYFTAHALEVFDAMGADPAQEAARQVLTHIKDNRLSGFTKRELFRGLSRTDFPAMSDLDPALTLLEEHGWVRQQPVPPRTGRGGRPPSPRYDTHPSVTPPLAGA